MRKGQIVTTSLPMRGHFCLSENRTRKSDNEKRRRPSTRISAYVKRTRYATPTQSIDFKSLHEIRATKKETYLIDIKRLSEIRTNASIGYVTDLIRLDVLRPNKLSMQPIDNKSESEFRTRFKTPLRQRNAPLTPTRTSATLPLSLQNQRPGLAARNSFRRTAPRFIV